jgi:hypothetical protein
LVGEELTIKPSGAGDPILSHAAVVAPIRTFNPRQVRTVNEITYGTNPITGRCQITTQAVTGNFIFDPISFSNVASGEQFLL